MRLAMAQMHMQDSMESNLSTSVRFLEEAKANGADLVLFPEVQLSPFFPQYEKRDASQWLVKADGPELGLLRRTCRRLGLWASPNIYLEQQGRRYDASLLIDAAGQLRGISKMVHITQAEHFYEQDYYTPAGDGFQVYDTPFGRIGIVICFDRHIPDSIRTCAKMGAELILIPTANLTTEPMELFSWEVRVQAFQNTVFLAMCNRVGREGDLTFAGESMAAAPSGDLLCKADDSEGLLLADLPLEQAAAIRLQRPWLAF